MIKYYFIFYFQDNGAEAFYLLISRIFKELNILSRAFQDLKHVLANSKTFQDMENILVNSRTFQDFQGPQLIFENFPGSGIYSCQFKDFPGFSSTSA